MSDDVYTRDAIAARLPASCIVGGFRMGHDDEYAVISKRAPPCASPSD